MALYTLGGNPGDAPFNRTFFNATLGDILERVGKAKEQRLTLYLSDGTTVDVCSIDELADAYVALRGYTKEEEGCDLSVQLIPYALVYRIEITPRAAEKTSRVGFHWAPAGRKTAHTSRRSPR